MREQSGDGKRTLDLAAATPMVVREYAHDRGESLAELRTDFAETLYWHPVLVLPDGKADVSFDLCDSATTFQVTAYAHTLDGRLGAGATAARVAAAVHAAAGDALEVTAGDKIDVPLSVANNTRDKPRRQVTLRTHDNLNLLDGKETDAVRGDGGKTARQVYRFQPTVQDGEAVLAFTGKAEPFAADGVRATASASCPKVSPCPGRTATCWKARRRRRSTLPETWVKGTLKCQVQVYPVDAGRPAKGAGRAAARAERLLRADLDQQLSQRADPRLPQGERSDQARRWRTAPATCWPAAISKLTSFECTEPGQERKEGYEWFGGTAPAHEALTAYGLLQFRDMAKVSRRRSGDDRSGRSNTCWRSATARAASSAIRGRSTRSAGRRTTSPTPTSSGR